MEKLTSFEGLLPGSRGHNLVLTVLYVPYSLDSRCAEIQWRGAKVLNLRTTSSQKCEAVPKRARIEGA